MTSLWCTLAAQPVNKRISNEPHSSVERNVKVGIAFQYLATHHAPQRQITTYVRAWHTPSSKAATWASVPLAFEAI